MDRRRASPFINSELVRTVRRATGTELLRRDRLRRPVPLHAQSDTGTPRSVPFGADTNTRTTKPHKGCTGPERYGPARLMVRVMHIIVREAFISNTRFWRQSNRGRN
uniref:Uncharacterized protein n=1 Tax=Anopheles minimus TaxID=112268 RepID=A0A182WLN9_9DIPT